MDIEQTKYRLKVFQKRVLNDSFWFRIMRENPNGKPKWKIKYIQIGMKVDLFPDDIIEQCTGYRDCNGTPIFEGDICRVKGKVWDNEKNKYVKVNLIDTVMVLEYFFSMLSNIYNYISTPTIKIEVIGNIHENPELVKE